MKGPATRPAGETDGKELPRLPDPASEPDGKELQLGLPDPASEPDGEEFYFALPDLGPNGWENYTLYPSRQRYERDYCFGGPPAHTETWQYEVRGPQVFHRLTDASEERFGDPVWEVINGTISEDGVRRNTWEDYVGEQIAQRRREVEWHECIGSVSLEILAIHFRLQPSEARGIFASKQERLTAAFAEIEKQLVTLGAIETPNGDGSYYTAPDGASEDLQKQIKDMQGYPPVKSRCKYSPEEFTFAEFNQRKAILTTLSRLLLGLQPSSKPIK